MGSEASYLLDLVHRAHERWGSLKSGLGVRKTEKIRVAGNELESGKSYRKRAGEVF
jgi:hypothetical protein